MLSLGQDSESFGEVAELGPRPEAGELEQVAGDEAGSEVSVGEFWCELFGLLQVVDGFADLAPHGMRCGEVDHVSRLPLRRQGPVVDISGQV